jgi:hypothetical protein
LNEEEPLFTETALIYRAAFSHAAYILFSNIESVEKSTVPVPFWMLPRLFKGLRIHLNGGKAVLVPLDFPHSSDISQRLTEVLNHQLSCLGSLNAITNS